MRLKSYFAPTVEAAMRAARRELGDDAMLVQSRRAIPEAQHLGTYEVVFALDEPGTGRAGALPPSANDGKVLTEQLTGQLLLIRREVERLSSALTGSAREPNTTSRVKLHPAAQELYQELIQADLAPDLACRVTEALDGEERSGRTLESRRSPADHLRSLIKVAPQLGSPARTGDHPPAVALVGPAGAGKTSMLIKLAIRYGLERRRSCQLLSADASRIGAAEQFRLYASILGLGAETYESVRSLEQGLDEHQRKGLILVDTPGYGAKDLDRAAELAEFLASRPDVDVHLVLPATLRRPDLALMTERFSRFEPAKLIFTRLDESSTTGNIVSAAAHSGLPVSFLSDGQAIPDDLEEATVARLVQPLLGSCSSLDPRPERPAPEAEATLNFNLLPGGKHRPGLSCATA